MPELPQLHPIGSASDRAEYEALLASDALRPVRELEAQALAMKAEQFTATGYCACCEAVVPFLVDMKWGGQKVGEQWVPNWRERLECPQCRMNNRQRLIAALVKQQLSGQAGQHVYFMEQTTPIFHWAQAKLAGHAILGSEYLGPQYKGGAVVNGVRHEDVEQLSFADAALDLIVSNDVFEHVPHPALAFAECARVLRPGGVMLATIPFTGAAASVMRAELGAEGVRNLLPPVFHGNPVSAEGSLVFTDFGWAMLDEMRAAGFREVRAELYAAVEFGHLGHGLQVFRLVR